jgi:hypothetical protein
MEKLSLEWVAGFFDGEGCVYIHRHRKKGKILKGRNVPSKINGYVAVATVTNTQKHVLGLLQQEFGGAVNKGGKSGRPNCKPVWAWSIRSQQAAAFLRRILPYLLLKHRQAEIGIELQETMRDSKKKLTVADVAVEAGIARSTCHECLRHGHSSRFSRATVDLVRAAAARIGYKRPYYEVPPEIMEKRESLRRELVILNSKGIAT